jgi:hypothetical protein
MKSPRKPNGGGGQPPPPPAADTGTPTVANKPTEDAPVKATAAPANKTAKRTKAQLLGTAAKAQVIARLHNSRLKGSKPKRASTGTEVIKFEDAFQECKRVFAKFAGSVREANMRLGEIAFKAERKYRDETLDKLGKKLEAELADKEWAGVFADKPQTIVGDGLAECTLARILKRNMSVWLAWDGDGKQAPAPVSWAVLMELQGHPNRLELVTANPHMPKAEARDRMRKYRGTTPKYRRKPNKKDEKPDEEDIGAGTQDTADERNADSDQDGTPNNEDGKQDRKYFKRLREAANVAEDIWHEYPQDPSVAPKYATVESLTDVRKAAIAWCLIHKRMKKDLCGEEAAAEGDANLRATVAGAQKANGNDEDPTQSAEDRKATYANEPDADDTTDDANAEATAPVV